jgi:hypothetical protein
MAKFYKLNDQSAYLLLVFMERGPRGFTRSSRPPSLVQFEARKYYSPNGLSMSTIRGLQKRGWITENNNHIFYLTQDGEDAGKQLLMDPIWESALAQPSQL